MTRFSARDIMSVMTRRSFTAVMSGAAAAVAGGDVVLEAVYGARLPESLRVPRALASAGRYFELRRYTGCGNLEDAFVRAGLRPRALGPLRYLFPFDSLGERSETWDRLNSLREWARIQGKVRLSEMTIFVNSSGRQPGGRIFEISL